MSRSSEEDSSHEHEEEEEEVAAESRSQNKEKEKTTEVTHRSQPQPQSAAVPKEPQMPTMKEIAETAEVIVRSARLYSLKLEAHKPGEPLDDKDVASIGIVLKQFPNVFHLLRTKATHQMAILEAALEQAANREDEWKSLSNLFNEYKNKVAMDIDNAKKLNNIMEKEIKLVEIENQALKKKLADLEDTLIRMDANQRRKENLARIKAEVEEEDRKIAASIRELRAAKDGKSH